MSSQPAGGPDLQGGAIRRVAEGVVTNLVTAAALWLAASLTGVVTANAALTAAAWGVVAAAVVVLAVAWLLADRRRLWLLRSVINWLNGSTVLGLVVAWLLGGRRREFDPHYRQWTVGGCARWPLAGRGYLPIGNVLLHPTDQVAGSLSPEVRVQAGKHATQYAALGGVLAMPLYALAAGVSWIRCRDTISANVFDLAADIPVGGYIAPPPLSKPPWYWAVWIGIASVPGATAGWLVWRVVQALTDA